MGFLLNGFLRTGLMKRFPYNLENLLKGKSYTFMGGLWKYVFSE